VSRRPLDQGMRDKLVGHGQYINAFGEDMPANLSGRWQVAIDTTQEQLKRIGFYGMPIPNEW
jgi:hypothetical protein